MSGMRLRRIVTAVAALVWPACRVFETVVNPTWGTRLSDAVAPLVAAVLLAIVVTSPAACRKYAARQPQHARARALTLEAVLTQLVHLAAKQERCEARQERAEDRQERCEKRVGYLFRTMAETAEEAGYSAPDKNETMPGGLRVIRLQGRPA